MHNTEIREFRWDQLTNPNFNRNPEDREAKIKKYGRFNPNLAGVPDVWIRSDSDVWILDGGGRQFMAVRDGFGNHVTKVTAHFGLDEDEARNIWFELNTNRANVDNLDTFLSAYRSGDLLERNIVETLTKHGLSVNKHRAPGVIQSTRVLYDAYQTGLLDDILKVAVEAFGALGEANNSEMLGALMEVINENQGRIDLTRLANQLRSVGSVKRFVEQAKNSRANEYQKTRTRIHASIVEAYNAGTMGTGILRLSYPKKTKRRTKK